MRRWLIFAAITAVVVAGILLVRSPIANGVRLGGAHVENVLRVIGDRPESVQDAAREQVLHMRHATLASLRADLLKLVAGEARFLADSGRYTSNLDPPFWSGAGPGNEVDSPRTARNGWWTTAYNQNLPILCGVMVGPDTEGFGNQPPPAFLRHAPRGEPVCVHG